jgi:dTMP kinase
MLIAIEGGDGCGKSTQVQLLGERLRAEGLPSKIVSFPRYDDPVFGDLIKRFLNGDLGDVDSVDPRLVALLFAGDRAAAAPELHRALCEERVVVCDRYFYSNLTYQAAKLPADEVAEFARWLHKLEFSHYAVPAPECSLYLDVHRAERRQRVLARAQSQRVPDGAVLDDIHERDGELQGRVEGLFRSYAQAHDDLIRIDCQQSGELLDPQAVHERIWQALNARGLLASAAARSPLPD